MRRDLRLLTGFDWVNDDIATIGSWFGYNEPVFSQRTLVVYDPDNFDLIPKKHHLENRLKKREQDLKNLQDIRKHYEKQEEDIKKDIEDIKSQINKK